MSSDKQQGFLERYGHDLIDAGYDIVPIKRGDKYPPFLGWEKIRATSKTLDDWLDEGYGGMGVGLICEFTPGVDIDVTHDELARHMEQWVHDNVAMAPVRVGNAPKRLLMFRCDDPFPKVNSQVFLDENGEKQKVEILGEGQQFVAFHIHPDTKKEYEWLYKDGPLKTDHDDLPTLTAAQARAIVDEFEAQAYERGWEPKRSSKRKEDREDRPRVISRRGGRDVFLEDSRKTEIDDDELREKLMLIPAQDDYDGWMQIGMALYHQYDGSDIGRDLWHDWSELVYGDEYDAKEIDDKWDKGKLYIDGKGRAPITARLIIKLAKEGEEEAAAQEFEEVKQLMAKCQDVPALKKVAEKIKKMELDVPTREALIGKLQERFKTVTGTTLDKAKARAMVRHESKIDETPKWLEDWMYLKGEDKFFNSSTGEMITQSAFNTAHARYLLTKQDVAEGKAMPERLPSHYASNIVQVPVLSGKRYMPGMSSVFKMDGLRYANTYSELCLPEVPDEDELTKADRKNIEIVKAHFTHLFPDPREARILLDYIAFIVQNPGQRKRWAVLLQGTEEDGKTFFAMLLGAVLGSTNVRMVGPKTVQTDFNGWAEGQQVVFIEEIRLHGHNRYDVLNQVKPLITNDVIEIHRKGVDPYNIPNMASYLLATNFRDALPLNENDSRYFVLFSRFQTKAALKAFKAEHPHYYSDLYSALADSAGALRGWLLEHEIGPEVRSGGRAPDSRAKEYMAMMAKPEEQQAIEEILNSSMRFDVSRTLLSATDLTELIYNLDAGIETPKTQTINKMLSEMGFTFLGRVKIDGRRRRYWSQKPELFLRDGKADTNAIRDWLDNENL